MSLRRISLAVVIALGLAVAVAFAQAQVTVVLTNGQSYNGSLVYRNNTVGVMTVNGLRSFPARNVAVIEFTPGEPDPDELSQVNTGITGFLSSAQQVLVLQDGEVITGNNVSISPDGNQVSINTSNGRNNYMASDIARLYLNATAAQRLLASNRLGQTNQGTIGTSGQSMQAQTISVPGNQHWTPTGIQVHQGDTLVFRASGRVSWAPGRPSVGPQGGAGISPNYPVPTAGVGALIGRVGNGQPFLVPTYGEAVTMPADGELYLGINDDAVSDNSGSYRVQIARSSGM